MALCRAALGLEEDSCILQGGGQRLSDILASFGFRAVLSSLSVGWVGQRFVFEARKTFRVGCETQEQESAASARGALAAVYFFASQATAA